MVIYIFGKTYKAVYFKSVSFIVCKLYFSEVVKKKIDSKSPHSRGNSVTLNFEFLPLYTDV